MALFFVIYHLKIEWALFFLFVNNNFVNNCVILNGTTKICSNSNFVWTE